MTIDRFSMQSRPTRGGLSGFVLSLALFPLGGCVDVLDPAGPIAAGERTLLLNSLTIMLAIIVPTIVATLAFAWWFRAGNTRARRRPDFTYSGRIEAVVWSIPTVTILFLGGLAWISSHDLDPPAPTVVARPTMEVQVVSLDWKWLFIYPGQGVASVNRAVIPAGMPVRFRITSATVMNGFFVPRLGSMIYAMNGMETKLVLQADKPGVFRGLSTHFSGDGFSGMRFAVNAVPPAQFAAWTAAAKARGPLLDRAGYDLLARESTDLVPYTYRAIDPRLYDGIVTQRVPPAAGPQKGRGGPTVSPKSDS